MSYIAISLLFSGEEAYGRYLDLYANHSMYNNLRHLPKRVSYLQYLDLLLASQDGPVHRDLPQDTRITKEFEACVYTYAVIIDIITLFQQLSCRAPLLLTLIHKTHAAPDRCRPYTPRC